MIPPTTPSPTPPRETSNQRPASCCSAATSKTPPDTGCTTTSSDGVKHAASDASCNMASEGAGGAIDAQPKPTLPAIRKPEPAAPAPENTANSAAI